MKHRRSDSVRLVGMVAIGVCLGCGMPNDPEGTYQKVRGGSIRVGISEKPPWTRTTEQGRAGIEVELLQEFAKQIDSDLEWRTGSESELAELLRHGKLDLVIAGFTQSTPWSKHLGLTQSYVEVRDETSGKMEKHVWAVRSGENRWVLELDEFLQKRRAKAQRLYQESSP